MKALSKDFLYCHQCKSIITDDPILIDQSLKIFCSDRCIENFFLPLAQYFERKELELRQQYHLQDEVVFEVTSQSKNIEQIIHDPDRVTYTVTSAGETFYSFFKDIHFNDKKYTMVMVCFYFGGGPSYIFLVTASRSQEFLEHFIFDEEIMELDAFLKQHQKNELPTELVNDLELKKNAMLAEILEIRKESDIKIEEYYLYDQFLEKTLLNPDTIYQWEDSQGDEISIYVRSFDHNGVAFYYFCLALVAQIFEDKAQVIPIISFPTVDGELYHHFCKGQQVSGPIKS